MRADRRTEIKVGLFVNLAIILVFAAIWLLGGTHDFFSRHVSYTVVLPSAEGLMSGSGVVIAGVRAGSVTSFQLTPEGSVELRIKLARKYERVIHRDAYAELQTQGVLGDRIVSIAPGTPEEPLLEPGREIPSRPAPGLAEVFERSDQLLLTLNHVAERLDSVLEGVETRGRAASLVREATKASKNVSRLAAKMDRQLEGDELKHSLENLRGILSKINHGTGTLGGLVNDPEFYDDMKALLGEANQNRILRNLVRLTLKKGEKAESEEQAGAAGRR